MNLVDFLFEHSKDLEKDLVLGSREKISYKDMWENILSLGSYLSRHKSEKIGLLADNSVFFISDA